jgi:hypothetical protein
LPARVFRIGLCALAWRDQGDPAAALMFAIASTGDVSGDRVLPML